MKTYDFSKVDLTGGYLFDKQVLNREITIDAVYDRFDETGRIKAFACDYKPGEPLQPHFFWDSDVAKWIEGAAYEIMKAPHPDWEKKIDDLVEQIVRNQGEDGYFNIFFTVFPQNDRFTERDRHELYCAGHLMEAAVAYAQATGKTTLFDCMEKYSDYIHQVFAVEHSAGFHTPGHEEIELALIRMYRYSGKKKFLDLAAHFINTRGTVHEQRKSDYNQSHLPVREQTEALGHSVRAVYLYTSMAYLAKETGDEALIRACKTLYEDMVLRKMYITGGLGSTSIGEAFTTPYDLPNDQAYTETCAAIGMIYFLNGMLSLENNAAYADVMEQVLYNGLLSGLSLDGTAFFYENPLEINLSERFESAYGARRFPITQRKVCFSCSCCPPNINRFLASLGNYLYGYEDGVLYVNLFASSTLQDGAVSCRVETNYPRDGHIAINAQGVKTLAVRIPSWCRSYTVNRPYTLKDGYAFIENDGSTVEIRLEMQPEAIYPDCRILRNAGKLCIRRGPVLYCAEGVDNGQYLHSFLVSPTFQWKLIENDLYGLPALDISCRKLLPLSGTLYSASRPETEEATLHLIPYNAFANRGESDMLVWLTAAH